MFIPTFVLPNFLRFLASPFQNPAKATASREAVLEKQILGLGFVCVFGLERCVLDSTSGKCLLHKVT